MMAPPNMGALSQEGRKKRSNWAPREAVEVEQETRDLKEFIDVDIIPSHFEAPIDPMLVVEERKGPITSAMEVDMANNAGGNPHITQETHQKP
jgi:hypothetical protein